MSTHKKVHSVMAVVEMVVMEHDEILGHPRFFVGSTEVTDSFTLSERNALLKQVEQDYNHALQETSA